MTDLSSLMAQIRELLPKVTPGPWRREAMGGSSTVLARSKPPTNDRRHASYGYRDEEFCLAGAFIDGDSRVRMDFVEFGHADASYISLLNPVTVTALIDRIEELEKALGPFAKAGQVIDSPFGPALFREDDMAFQSGCAWSENGERRTITWGDFRAARAALSEVNGEEA